MKITLLTLALAFSSLLASAQQTVKVPANGVPVKSIATKETATINKSTTSSSTSKWPASRKEAMAEPKKVKAANPKKIK